MRLHLKTQYMLKGYAVNRNAVSGQKYEDLKKAATSTPPSIEEKAAMLSGLLRLSWYLITDLIVGEP